jgi:hypothetical protein
MQWLHAARWAAALRQSRVYPPYARSSTLSRGRLIYDPDTILNRTDDPARQRMLREIADKESEHFLYDAYRTYHGLAPDAILNRLLGIRSKSARRLAMVFLASNPDTGVDSLANWLQLDDAPASNDEAGRLLKAYDPSRLNLSDYGYLLNRHPLDVWCAGQLIQSGEYHLG